MNGSEKNVVSRMSFMRTALTSKRFHLLALIVVGAALTVVGVSSGRAPRLGVAVVATKANYRATMPVPEPASGNSSGQSVSMDKVAVVADDSLAPQKNDTTAGATETVVLTWEATPGATYAIQYNEGSGWVSASTVKADDSSATATMPSLGGTRIYRVQVADAGSAE